MLFLPFHDASLQSATVSHSLKCFNNLTLLTKSERKKETSGETDMEIIFFQTANQWETGLEY